MILNSSSQNYKFSKKSYTKITTKIWFDSHFVLEGTISKILTTIFFGYVSTTTNKRSRMKVRFIFLFVKICLPATNILGLIWFWRFFQFFRFFRFRRFFRFSQFCRFWQFWLNDERHFYCWRNTVFVDWFSRKEFLSMRV